MWKKFIVNGGSQSLQHVRTCRMLQRLKASIDSGESLTTFRLLTCTLRAMASKFWNCSSAQWRRSCQNLWQTCAWPGVSTSCFTSTRTSGNRLFAGHSNGSVTFHLARLKVGEGKVAVSIVRYICWHLSQERDSNSTCFKFIYIYISDIIHRLFWQSVVSTMRDL